MNPKPVMMITGTRTGIGLNLAKHYSDGGFNVIGCSRGKASTQLDNYSHYCLDVTDEPAVLKMFDEVRQDYGNINVLINNAGIASVNYALLTPLETVKKVSDTNFLGTFLFSREAIKLMMPGKFGRILNLSSIHVALASAGSAAYSASKAAVEQLSRVLAREVASYGITVNTMALSFVEDSGMIEQVKEEEISKILERSIHPTRLTYADIFNVVDFLIRPESQMITGQTVHLGAV